MFGKSQNTPTFFLFLSVTLALLILAGGVCRAEASREKPRNRTGEWRIRLALAPVLHAGSEIDGGGDVRAFHTRLNIGAEKRWTPSFGSGLSLKYSHSRFEFDQSLAFGENAPWENIHEAALGGRIDWNVTRSWTITARPSLEIAREEGAEWDGSAVGGLAATLSKRFGRKLSVGLGAAAFSGLEEDRVYPLLIVFWRISEHWRLANPFRPGPTSPAGLELSYRIDTDLEAGLGTTYRSQRFRLDERGPAPGGIGESRAFLSYLRLSREMTDSFGLDLYAGLLWEGKLTLEDENGHELTDAGYGPGILFALALKGQF